jgi:hypothetical protein
VVLAHAYLPDEESAYILSRGQFKWSHQAEPEIVNTCIHHEMRAARDTCGIINARRNTSSAGNHAAMQNPRRCREAIETIYILQQIINIDGDKYFQD